MSLVIVTFADLGKKENLKTPTIAPVIDKFHKTGDLKQVICRINSGFYFKNTYGAVNVLPKLIKHGIKKYIKPDLDIRNKEFQLVDKFASRKINIQKDDVVLFHPDNNFPLTFDKVKQQGGKTLGVTTVAHNSYTKRETKKEKLRFGLEVKEDKKAPSKSKQDRILEAMDHFFVLSEFARGTYIKAGYPAEKISVATTDIDLNRFKGLSQKKDDVFRVICVARFKFLKGLHYLLEAWKDLDVTDKELVIVGNFNRLPDFLRRQYLDQINEDPTIKYKGATSRPEKYLVHSSVFVFPSLFPEGCPKVVLEAMACSLPVITTKNGQGIIRDQKDGFIVPRRDVSAITEKMKYLYNNPEVAKKMGREARKSIENKEKFADQVYDIYKKINKIVEQGSVDMEK